MKIEIALLAAALLAGCTQPASDAEQAAATPAPAAAASDVAPAPPAIASTGADMGMDPAAHQKMAGADAKTDAGAKVEAMGMGVVKSVDTAAGKVTIAHEPIAALNWPSMTMAFSASPQLLAAAKEGQRVHFEFTQGEVGSTLTVLQPTK